jgi:Xaa-Pro aminopeptidase
MKNNLIVLLQKKKLFGILLLNTSLNNLDPNLNYLTGMTFEYGVLLLTKKKSVLFVPQMEYERAKKKSNIRNIKVIGKDLIKQLAPYMQNKKVGINFENVTLHQLRRLRKTKAKFSDIGKELKTIRVIKTTAEIAIIKEACMITEQIFAGLFKNLKKLKTEQEIFAFLEQETQKRGCKTSFKTIVASGSHAAQPHAEPENTLRKGFLVIDFGLRYKGYCSDVTRTVHIGNPSQQERQYYSLVLLAQQQAIASLKNGIRAKTIDGVARTYLGDYQKYFIHGLGHGIGVEIHEAPSISVKSKDVLKENMVFTIEPGIYLPGKLGIRIEDDIVLTKKGPIVLTKNIPKHLICV